MPKGASIKSNSNETTFRFLSKVSHLANKTVACCAVQIFREDIIYTVKKMAPVHNVSSYSVASTSSATSSSSSKVIKSGGFRREPSESEDRFHSVTSKGFSFSDSLFENARERFHHRVRRILDDWDMAGGIDDSWFGKRAISRAEFDHERVSAHSGESEEKNIYAAVSENGDYEIRMDIVSMRLKDVRVRVAGQRRLVVEGSKVEEGEMNVCRHCQRKTLYQFSLPDDAKVEAISATFSCDGILIITVPTKIITCERSGRYLQENILSETKNLRQYSTAAQPNFTEPSQGSTTLVKEKEKESQQLCMNKNYTSEMERSNSVFQKRAFDVNCAPDSAPEAFISDVHLEKGRKSKEVIIPVMMVESDDVAERKQEMACSKEPEECSSSSEQLSSVQRQSNHHTSASSEATLSTEAEGSIVQRRQTQKQGLAATESLSVTSNEELQLENGITVNGHKKEDVDQIVMVAEADTETSNRTTYDHRRTLQHKISDSLLSPRQEVCCEKIQWVGEMKTAWDVHHSEDDSLNSVMEGKQSLDSDEMHKKSSASESSVLLEIREKGSFLKDLHFVSMREAMTSALRETLSEYNAVPSDEDLLSFYRQLMEQNAIQHIEPLSVTQEDDTHYKIVIDVSTLRRTGIAVFLLNRNEIQVVEQPLQRESDYQVSEIFKRFALPEEISNVATSASLSSDGFLMITVVKKRNLNELTTEEDNGMAGFLTLARDDSFEIRKQNLTTESSTSSLATVVHEEHLTEPDSSSNSKEEDTLIEESFSSTSDQVSTNLLDSCTSMSSVIFDKEQPCSIEEQESDTPKHRSVIRNSISSECNETDALVSATDASSVEIQGEHKANDISLYKKTFIGKENSSECHESSTHTEQSEASSFLEYQQHKARSCEALESEKEADTSENSSSIGNQNFDINDLVSASHVNEETNEETSSSGSCILLNVQEKGLFDEDIFFQNIRHKLQAKERKLLSRERDVSSIAEDFGDKENLCLLDCRNDNQTVTVIDDGDQFMIIIDVSESANVKELQLEVVGNNTVLIKGSAVTNGAEQDDVKTFSERLDLPAGIDVESGHCATSEDGVLVIAFSKVTSAAAERISTDNTMQICISGDECPDYGEMMLSTTVENINTSNTNSKDFMKSVTSAQTKRSAEHNLSAGVTGLSGIINDSFTTGHSTNNSTKPETMEDTSDALDVGLEFDERCDGIFSVQGSSEKEKGHILKTSCELNQTLQRGLDNLVNVPSLDSHNKMEEFTKEGFSGAFNMETASCFVSDSSLRISEEEKATSSNEETSANEETLMMERREDEFSDSIGGDELRQMQEYINITSFKHNHLSSSQEEEEEQRFAKDYEENEVSSSRANGRMLLRKDSVETVGDLEHQKELEALSCVAEKAVKGYFCPENYVTLKLQEKGLFAEDAFFESTRLHLLAGGGESSPNSGSLSYVSDELANTKKLYGIDHLDQNKVATFTEDEDYYTIILDVSCYSEKERVKVSVIEERELSIEYSCVASDSELEFMKTFSTRFVLPSGIDSGSGLCGISSDGILAVKFSKQKHSSSYKLERREDAGETQNRLNVDENLAYTTHFLQNRDTISAEAKSDIVGVSDSKEFTSKTFSRFKIHSDSSDIQEHNNINVTMLPFIKKGHFFHDSFFTEAQRLLQEAIKKVLMQCSEEETCRHSSDIKTYKCLRKQNPTWQNQAFHLEEDQNCCKVLLDAESLSEGSTVVYVLEGTELVIECQQEMKGGSSHSLQTCKRSFSLPPNVDVNEATSALSSDGVLFIVFSKRDIP